MATPGLRLLLMTFILSATLYQIYSFFVVSSLENLPTATEYPYASTIPPKLKSVTGEPLFRSPDSTIHSFVSMFYEPQWPETHSRTIATNEQPNDNDISLKTDNLPKQNIARQLCTPPDLGPIRLIRVNTSDIPLAEVERKYPQVKWGGWYSPPDCIAPNRVAIIVPYRDRAKNLATFLYHMHKFLMRQKLEYGIFIVEQKGRQEFNRGKLLNVGFLEATGWQCFIFHDIDILPVDLRNFYSCPHPLYPRLYTAAVAMDEKEKETFKGNFGGVSALTEEQFTKVNGYSNGYWGWGGEDNDLYYRLTVSGYTVKQYDLSIAKYIALNHKQKSPNPRRYRLLIQTVRPVQSDGLSSLEYKLLSTTHHRLYTHFLVNVDHTYQELQDLFQERNRFKQLQAQFAQVVVPSQPNSTLSVPQHYSGHRENETWISKIISET